MSRLVAWHMEDLPNSEPCCVIRLQAPRANALEPGILDELHRACDALAQSDVAKALITGGPNFSTGGDVGRFAEAARAGQGESYAAKVVSALQALVLRMVEMPVVLASAVRGAATGGSAGIVFASDLVVAAPDAFVQPYYGVVGFAPDGGWTALLPELIGGANAKGWIMANHRQGAERLESLGLVQAVDPNPEARAAKLLAQIETGTALATKSLFWDDRRRAVVKTRLEAETESFKALIGRPETLTRMQEFLQPRDERDV
ncbi:Cyclohexa-1,5-dienecarbonyl-CoA hydratase [Pseudoruegeria aquimaris]|uniref:Cyclohexa-1,5-dienecarbonyl-CoA hydratase n=1 Tax=Pseudoruegeria aquimaris TaxID=393663 RepID=A0A1Y5RGF0_9RHOB|nr:enoyl-CoA hydratase/isomerase family protein [Pseudoruegeria aquimaris]SLN16633.1 Cyclohexa-1,5-dienecarbonyl-CoA hydratase [Pseudoruegeria aquimaris]